MQGGHGLHDGQPPPGAMLLSIAAARRVHAVKALEQVRQMLRRDWRPGIADGHFQPVAAPQDVDHDLGARRGILDRVLQQVRHGAPEQGRVDQRTGLAVAIDAHPHAGLVQQEFEELSRLADLVRQHRMDTAGRSLALIGARQEQHVVDHGPQAVQLLEVRLQHLLQVVRTAPARQGHLGLADQASNWL
ncbi:hypothetical protein G6F65_020832 [Rhizopus arrhizus]|nr:hypothetical protein G6F65_020832 [Rhizopus arrhizus]